MPLCSGLLHGLSPKLGSAVFSYFFTLLLCVTVVVEMLLMGETLLGQYLSK